MSNLALALGWQQVVSCYECGVEFASAVIAQRRADGQFFYCPNGHSQHFIETEAVRLRKQLESAQRDRDWWKSQQQTAHARLIAQRGQTTRLRNKLNRVHKGVCPECRRTFGNLARHMKTNHQ